MALLSGAKHQSLADGQAPAGNEAQLRELDTLLLELERRQSENRLAYYQPYARQKEFHDLGSSKRERLFSAANQVGKTLAGGMEMAMHLTGIYADWWQGYRYTGPVRTWAAGKTSEAVRDTVQRILLGATKPYGSGTIPKDMILQTTSTRGIADAADTIYVRHSSGGKSSLSFKSYEKGREKWQGETLDAIWFDEEPPADIYTEGLARLTARNGIAYTTFTPLQGMSTVVSRFFDEEHPDRGMVRMQLEEAGHITPEMLETIISGYPEYERDARVRGLPMLGSGRVYAISEAIILEEAFAMPEHWPRIVGIDFGWDHPTAAVWLAWDRDTDTVHLYDSYRREQATIGIHAAAIRAKGPDIPVAWPHDGLQADRSSGVPMRDLYRQAGVAMLEERASFPGGGASVEAGVLDLLDRMQTGRFRVFSHLGNWIDEFRLYHRKDGCIVKRRDDLLDATRYAVMMLRSSRVVRNGIRRRKAVIAKGRDYDLFSV